MSIMQRFSHENVKIIAKHDVYQGFFKMVEYHVQHALYAGGWSQTLKREMFERGHAVALLPYDPHTDEFVLIQQFRLGAMATCDNPWLLEVIAGMIDPGLSGVEV